ncbi:MAG: replicative DNA helicase [Clostridia bacterium]|nr:replicative DNA helicase [Clostridia bacterium]
MAENSKNKANNSVANARVLPYSREAEQSLLGCILLADEVSMEILSNLSDGDFYIEQHKKIVQAMKNLIQAHSPVDFVTVADELDRLGVMNEIGGIGYLSEVNSIVPSSANWKYYFEIVKRHSTNRSLIKTATEIMEEAYSAEDAEKMLASAEGKIYKLSAQSAPGELEPLFNSISEVWGKFEQIQKNPDSLKGVPTGFRTLDKETNGFHAGELIIIAGRPGMGKTSLAMNMIEHAALNANYSCAVFSLEMSSQSLAQRSICSVAGVPMGDALKGKLTQQQWQSLWKASQGFSQAKIYVDDTANITVDQMLSKCRRLKSKHGLDMVLVDYIQLMKGDEKRGSQENRQQEVADISRGLKLMARELEVPVLALSQLKRTGGNEVNKKPQLSDLRESGAIEQDADIVLMIYKPEAETDQNAPSTSAAVYVAKHRNGRNDFDINMDWIGEIVRFRESDSYSMALTKQFEANQQAKKEREMQRLGERDDQSVPMPDEAPPETDEVIIDNFEG